MESQLIKEFLKRNRERTLNIFCVGDAMLDEYNEVKINRISPEHPVAVMACQSKVVQRPGGAANVAYQFKHLNAETHLFCMDDPKAVKVFKEHHISTFSFSTASGDPCCELPIKRRYLDQGVQVAPRHDIEKPSCGLTPKQIDSITQALYKTLTLNSPDVAIFSDYDKGMFHSSLFQIPESYKDTITIVDPKCGPLSKWKGCKIFKPNCNEAAALSGKAHWRDQARYFQDELQCEAVVITFGGEKVAGIWKDDDFVYRPERRVNVESVIGAGDCFAAFFAAAVGHGFTPPEAANIAWNAGSIYVQQKMNRPVVPAELSIDKIVAPEDLAKRDFKLSLTNGCFDIVHRGHIESLKFARSKGDKLVVAVNSDESVRRAKGPSRPVVPLDDRMAVLASFEFVDFVVSFDEDTPLEVIENINPDALVKGSDYQFSKIAGAEIVPEVYLAPMVPGVSTSKLLENYSLSQQQQQSEHLQAPLQQHLPSTQQ